MGVFDSLEKKLEGAVQGAFARAFKGDVQPVEITARIQRELDAQATLLTRDRKLVPNDFTVSLSRHDFDRLSPYSKTLNEEIMPQIREYAADQGYVFNGPIQITYLLSEKLPIGKFQIESRAIAGVAVESHLAAPEAVQAIPVVPPEQIYAEPVAPAQPNPIIPAVAPVIPIVPPSAEPAAPTPSAAPDPEIPTPVPAQSAGTPMLVLEINGVRHPLTPPGFIIGRGTDADVRINDPGISRKHARVQVADGRITIEDLGSTNGIIVNAQRVKAAVLLEGSRVEIGSTRMSVVASYV